MRRWRRRGGCTSSSAVRRARAGRASREQSAASRPQQGARGADQHSGMDGCVDCLPTSLRRLPRAQVLLCCRLPRSLVAAPSTARAMCPSWLYAPTVIAQTVEQEECTVVKETHSTKTQTTTAASIEPTQHLEMDERNLPIEVRSVRARGSSARLNG
jgi:hypothetical protein